VQGIRSSASEKNNVGFLRLLFATLVVIGHAPEMIDGGRVREPLTVVFHTLSLGELSVDGFFLLSGYLITKSMVQTKSLGGYLERRILRIYPAFVVANLLGAFLLAPFVGAHPLHWLPKTLVSMVYLKRASFPGQLVGLPIPDLNGSMWTIPYEFRCYLLIAMLGVAGWLLRRKLILVITAAALVLCVVGTFPWANAKIEALAFSPVIVGLVGSPWQTLRLTTIFLIGACFYLYWDKFAPRLNAKVALACTLGAALLMFNPHTAEFALVTLGAYALFWLAFRANLGPVQKINDRWDISYGVYLYGWPIATAVLWVNRGIEPWLLCAIALPLSLAAGAASWWGVEKWTKDLVRSRSRPSRARESIRSEPAEFGNELKAASDIADV
jgi:peptidoglycan/LPS O-acetylase OafA/YrhL